MQCINKKKIEAFANSKKIIHNPTNKPDGFYLAFHNTIAYVNAQNNNDLETEGLF